MIRILLLLCLSIACSRVSAATSHVYVSAGTDNRIILYHLDTKTGKLTEKGNVATEGGPGALAFHPDGKHLYAALRTIKSVATYEINPADGSLKLKAITPVVNNPVYLAIDRTGSHLLMASYNGDQAATYRLNEDRTVTNAPSTIIATGKNPHSILTDPSNKFVYIPNCGSDQVQQYSFDAKTGALSPLRLAAVTTPANEGPRHFTFHPSKPWVLVVNEKASTVTSYEYSTEHGSMKVLDRQPTLPSDFSGKNTTADIHVTPDGKFVYASNRGHDSLAAYAIDQTNGKLKPLGQTPTEKTPREFDIDPGGDFLIAAGQASHQLATYRIDRDSGALKPLNFYLTGKGPAWVLIREAK
ncbi:MAG TPA: lactonase family protein [Verrucomicrobiae bacterium]